MPLSVICLQYTSNLFQFEFFSHALVCDFVFQKKIARAFYCSVSIKKFVGSVRPTWLLVQYLLGHFLLEWETFLLEWSSNCRYQISNRFGCTYLVSVRN